MLDKLNRIKSILESDDLADKEKETKKSKDDKVENDIDLEKELSSTGDTKEDYNKNIIDVINKMIEGNASIDDLEKVMKSKKIKKDGK